MFSNLREKISDKLAAASLALTGDDNDRLIADIVARATSEELIAPEWSLNHSLIDLVNLNPNNSRWAFLSHQCVSVPCTHHLAELQIRNVEQFSNILLACMYIVQPDGREAIQGFKATHAQEQCQNPDPYPDGENGEFRQDNHNVPVRAYLS